MSRSSSIGPATIGHLRRDRRWLEIFCQCGRHAYIDPSQTEWPDEVAVPEAKRLMRCSKCGQRPSQTKPDSRVAGVDGNYPQF